MVLFSAVRPADEPFLTAVRLPPGGDQSDEGQLSVSRPLGLLLRRHLLAEATRLQGSRYVNSRELKGPLLFETGQISQRNGMCNPL